MACNEDTTGESAAKAPASITPEETSIEESSVEVAATPDPSFLFLEDSLVSDITEKPCTLSGGTETMCYRITVTSIPIDHEPGPLCPGTITDSAEAGGIWPENGEINDVDGPFVENLDTFYNDGNWKLYNDDGTIRVTGTAEQCAAAARPDVDEAYQNYCVQCLPAYVEEGVSVHTYVIPREMAKGSCAMPPQQEIRPGGGGEPGGLGGPGGPGNGAAGTPPDFDQASRAAGGDG